MPGLDLYQSFVVTVSEGSITAAAGVLGVSRPTLSRQLAALEERLGLALLHRTTRQVRPTPAGQRLYEQLQPLLGDLARVEASMQEERDEVTGLLRVSVPPVIAPDISRMLVQLRQEHPRLRVELLADIRWAELRADGVEVAIRAGRHPDPSLIQRRLGSSDVSAVAAPGYLERRGVPADVAALVGPGHLLLRGHSPDGTPQRWWPLRDGGHIPVDGAFASNDQLALRAAALAEGGIAMLSEASSGALLAEGRLVRVLPAVVGTRLRLHAVFVQRTRQPARVRVFVEALVRWFAAREDLYGV